jgi:hypothetical protein
VFWPIGIRASGHQGIGHQGIGHQASGIRVSGILGDGHRLYSLTRFQHLLPFCGSCYMKNASYLHSIDICALLYSFYE